MTMIRHDGGPVAPQGGNAPADGTVTAPVTVGAVIPMRRGERAVAVARRAGNAARELWLHPDRLGHVIAHGEAGTMAEHRAYVESRAWVPAGMSEAAEKAVTFAGLIHYLIVARSVKRAMKAVKFAAGKIDHAADRAVSFYIAAAIITALIVLLSVYL